MTFDNFLVGGVWAFLIVFARIGAFLMIMPGTGDNFTPVQARLLFALAFSYILTPVLLSGLPPMPASSVAIMLILAKEVFVGIFFGTIARMLMAILDTAGMIISMQSSLANAQIFNPQFASQGSLIGAMMSLLGLVMLFALNLHHVLLTAAVNSYDVVPANQWSFPAGDFAQGLAQVFANCFLIAVQLCMPFFLIILMLYIAMGVLARLMPQLQIFVFAIPVQVLLSLTVLVICLQIIMTQWGQFFMDTMLRYTGGGNG